MEVHLRRSLLFAPANDPQRINDAFNSAADAIAIDLEDAVPLAKKVQARRTLQGVFDDLDFAGKECFLRINAIGTIECLHDLLLLQQISKLPHTIIAPTAESAREIELLDSWLSQIEKPGQTPVEIAVILESAQGLFRASEIVKASPRVTAVLFGGGDLSGQIGCAEQWEPLQQARHTVILAATLTGIDSFDVPFRNADDEDGLRAEAARVAKMGFRGKGMVHPRQADIVNDAFTPSKDTMAWAQAVVAAADQHGTGALRVGGQMVDPAVLKRARKINAMATILQTN